MKSVLLALVLSSNLLAPMWGPTLIAVERRLPASASGRLRIVIASGSVRVRPGDGPEIRVVGLVAGCADRLSMEQRRDGVVLAVAEAACVERSLDVDLLITAPPSTRVEVRAGPADVRIEGMSSVRIEREPPELGTLAMDLSDALDGGLRVAVPGPARRAWVQPPDALDPR